MKFFEKKLKYHRIPYTNAIQEIMDSLPSVENDSFEDNDEQKDCFKKCFF